MPDTPDRAQAASGSNAVPPSVDVISDIVCPWCFIGKRRLEQALEDVPLERRPAVRWLPFQLNPDLPAQGMPRHAYLAAKFGSAQQAAQIYQRVREQGASIGIGFEFDRIERQPNTVDAHRLIAWAQAQADAGPLVEALFNAFFIEGRDLADSGELAAIAGEAGFDATAAGRWLASEQAREQVLRMDRRARELGVTGVPFFIFNGAVAVAGAQEPAILRDAMVQSGLIGEPT
ncbi:MAG TPA: DsbA family oxidoreductase [Burkholderiaceae bacterium]|nr:DsbA family oxidoreductase [Burkholderiaceae bacterium]